MFAWVNGHSSPWGKSRIIITILSSKGLSHLINACVLHLKTASCLGTVQGIVTFDRRNYPLPPQVATLPYPYCTVSLIKIQYGIFKNRLKFHFLPALKFPQPEWISPSYELMQTCADHTPFYVIFVHVGLLPGLDCTLRQKLCLSHHFIF